MARLVVLAFLVAGVAGSGGRVLHGYGMSVTLPPDWHGRISHGLVRVRGEGLRFEIRESSPGARPDPFFHRRTVPTLHARDFRSSEHHLGFTLSGRDFALLPFPTQRPAPSAIHAANGILGSFTVKRGRFYGQSLVPARFPVEPGWFVGARGGKLLAEGGQTETWAATVRYRDPPLQIPPVRTLRSLAPDGVVIWVSLSRDSAVRLRPSNSLHIRRRLISNDFEGLPRGTGLYRATVRRPAYDIDLWVFFRGVRPSTRAIASAQAELDRLRLPAWPAG